MNRQTLADRIVTYSDTVVAFALVNGFAFLITLAEPDIRCSIANMSGVAIALNLIVPVVATYALFWLRGYQYRLRYGRDESGDDSPPETVAEEDELVSRFWRIAFGIRLALIWTFGLIVIAGIYAATLDSRCGMVSG